MRRLVALTLVLLLTGCSALLKPGAPSSGPFSPAVVRGELTALVRIAGDLNKEPGPLHVSDADLVKLTTAAGLISVALQAYENGANTLQAAAVAAEGLDLPPGIGLAAKNAFEAWMADHDAQASTLTYVKDVYAAALSGLSIDGQQHPVLRAVLTVIGGALSVAK